MKLVATSPRFYHDWWSLATSFHLKKRLTTSCLLIYYPLATETVLALVRGAAASSCHLLFLFAVFVHLASNTTHSGLMDLNQRIPMIQRSVGLLDLSNPGLGARLHGHAMTLDDTYRMLIETSLLLNSLIFSFTADLARKLNDCVTEFDHQIPATTRNYFQPHTDTVRGCLAVSRGRNTALENDREETKQTLDLYLKAVCLICKQQNDCHDVNSQMDDCRYTRSCSPKILN